MLEIYQGRQFCFRSTKGNDLLYGYLPHTFDSLFYFLQSPFIDDESETTETIVWEAINSFTGDNPYPSAKPVIAALFEAEKFNDYPYKDIIFDGEFKEKGFKVFWRENQFWLVILLLSLLLFISRFFW